jgi:HEAT repeat protein
MTKKRKVTKKAASKKSPAARKTSARSMAVLASSSSTPIKQRVQAMTSMTSALATDEKSCQTALKLLKDAKQPSQVRLAALQALQAASFSVISFESCQSDYVAALRKVMEDEDLELRQRVLGILSRQKDPVAQQKLLDGLNNPEKALVSTEKALQLLAYDMHNEAYAAARQVVENPPNTTAKREALRLLASDSSAAPLFERVLRDKNENADIRQVSAAALNTIDPESLQKNARELLLDTSEDPQIQATSLTALNQLGLGATEGTPALRRRVNRLAESDSDVVQESARTFLEKYDV